MRKLLSRVGLAIVLLAGAPDATAVQVSTKPEGPITLAPACPATLEGAFQRFQWLSDDFSPGEKHAFRLTVGTARGLADLFDSGRLEYDLGVDVPDLPVDGRTLYVRLRWLDGSSAARQDCTYTAASLPRPSLVAPVCGAALSGAGARFEWADNGWPVLEWRLQIGAVRGGTEYSDSGVLGADVHAADVSTLPGDGSTVHARLRYRTRIGGWQRADCTFVAATLAAPALVLPACGSTLDGPDASFSWNDNGWAVAAWRLRIGLTPGGNEVFQSARLAPDVRTLDLTGLPGDGETLYVRLQYLPFGFARWQVADCTLLAHSLPKPSLTGPPCGGALTGTSTAFAWDDAGRTASAWRLSLGSRVGGAEYYDSGGLGPAARSVVAKGLPRDGRPVQARLRWLEGGVWKRVDCPYTAFAGRTIETGAGPYIGFSKGSCSGHGPIFAALSPCSGSCPTSGELWMKIEQRGSATPPAPPIPDLTGVWRGASQGYFCSSRDALNIPRFSVTQSEDLVSGRFATDAGISEIGCSYSCSGPGACSFRCTEGDRTLECNVSCTPATQGCRSEFEMRGVVLPSDEIDPERVVGVAVREQRVTFQCGENGAVTLGEQEEIDFVLPMPAP